jgi:hypothetical protein
MKMIEKTKSECDDQKSSRSDPGNGEKSSCVFFFRKRSFLPSNPLSKGITRSIPGPKPEEAARAQGAGFGL